MSYNSNYHSVFDMNYHMIFCIKYRREVINDEISHRLKEIVEKICPKSNSVHQEWEHDVGHIHMLINAMPNTELSKFVNTYKSASSRLIKKEFPEIRRRLWKEYFWSRSYLVVSVGGAPLEIIKKYIQNQKEV